jgi:peptidoglycan/LPS O-acetylase OafA/YrhL
MSKTDFSFQFIFLKKVFYFFDKFNFYFISGRIFELILGSLLSYFELNYIRKYNLIKSDPILSKVCPGLGMLLILYSFIFFDIDSTVHPSFNTLIPLIGTILVIFFSKKDELTTKLLSSKFFVFFGLISYSLYLWHYPVFSYLRYILLFEQFWVKFISIILIIILSILSFEYIEKPFRNKNTISTKKILATFFTVLIILLSYHLFVLKRDGIIKDNIPNILTKQLKFRSDEIMYNKNQRSFR